MAEDVVESLTVKASKAIHAEITVPLEQADTSGRCTIILNRIFPEEAGRKAKEILSYIDNKIDPNGETAEAAEVGEDEKDS